MTVRFILRVFACTALLLSGIVVSAEEPITAETGADESAAASPGYTIQSTTYDRPFGGPAPRRVDSRFDGRVWHTWIQDLPGGVLSPHFEGWDPVLGFSEYGGIGFALDFDPENAYANLAVLANPASNAGAVVAKTAPVSPSPGADAIWATHLGPFEATVPGGTAFPVVEHQILPVDDTVTYLAVIDSPPLEGYNPLSVLRKEGGEAAGTWTTTSIDTTWQRSYDIAASRVTQNVAVVYMKKIPSASADSGWNDIYYRESNDMGITWGPPINITNYIPDTCSHVAWNSLSSVYDLNGGLHIVWQAATLKPEVDRAGRIFHWASTTGAISTVAATEWPAGACTGPEPALHVDQLSISVCNGKLYTLWTQYLDPELGITDDCASPALIDSLGAANGDLYVSVAPTVDGVIWDFRRNLTQTYTPNCDGSGTPCGSEVAPTMSRVGYDTTTFGATDFPSGVYSVDPAPLGYTGNSFLDVQFIEDIEAGVSASPGSGSNNNVKWFRLPCVDPLATPVITTCETKLFDTLETGATSSFYLPLENVGSSDLAAVLAVDEGGGPAGWLDIDMSSLLVPAGLAGKDSIEVFYDASSIPPGASGDTLIEGSIVITSDAVNAPTYTIDLCLTVIGNTATGSDVYVAPSDTVELIFDSVSTAGHTSVSVSGSGPPLPSGFTGVPTGPVEYFDISTNAEYEDSITVCIKYDPADVSGPESDLVLLHDAGNGLMEIPSEVDVQGSRVCGRAISLSPFVIAEPTADVCCVGLTGNVSGDAADEVSLTDLTVLVNHLFVTFESLPCAAEANTNGDAGCNITLTDLTVLTNHLFVTFEPLAPCDPACE